MTRALKIGAIAALVLAGAPSWAAAASPEPLVTVRAAAPAPARFDLDCEGVDSWRGSRHKKLIKIDLERGFWCEGDCRSQTSIAGAGPQVLLLERYQGRHLEELSVSRDQDGLISYRDFFASNFERKGSCTPLSFSGPSLPGASLSPPGSADMTLAANWIARPTPERMAASYPIRLRAFGGPGEVKVRCEIGSAGKLAGCQAINARPALRGLQGAAVRLAREFQAAALFWPAVPAEPGTPLELSFEFRASR